MSLIEKYDLLKKTETITDCLKYLRKIPDPTPIINTLNQSTSSYDDWLIFILYSIAQKDQNNLFNAFNRNDLPVRLRIKAAKAWLKIETDETRVHQFVVNTLKDKLIPRRLKNHILIMLHSTGRGKNFSTSFYYNLALALTQFMDHDQFNIDAHTVPYCSSETQVLDLLSRWSISRLNQIDPTSPLRSKLIHYQPLIMIQLIKNDLQSKYNIPEQLENYIRQHRTLFDHLAQREPKAMCCLAIDYLNHLERHKRVLPSFVETKQTRLLAKAPTEMIQLLLLAAQSQIGTIKYKSSWGSSSCNLNRLSFPSSFSIDHYVQLFLGLYHTCNWSSNHLTAILELMLPIRGEGMYAVRKRSKWFNDIVIQREIGKDVFMKKLLTQGDDNSLAVLCDFPDLRAPLSRQLLEQLERTTVVTASQQIDYLRCEPMTKEVFDKLLLLFKEISSDVNQRAKVYQQLLRSSVATSSESASQTLQWITKRFTNEQLIVLDNFLRSLNDYNDQFHLDILPKNIESIEQIMNIAFGHLQCATNTIQTIFSYAFLLLKRAEFCRQTDNQTKIRDFACKTIQRCFSADPNISSWNCQLNRSTATASNLFANLLINDLFPILISKAELNKLQEILIQTFEDRFYPDQIDHFLESFFFDHLAKSKKLQTQFKINEFSSLINYFLKRHSTRLSRAQRLVTEFGEIFLTNDNVQQILIRSRQNRGLINKLVQRNKSVTLDDLINEANSITIEMTFSIKTFQMPGLSLNTLNTCVRNLTGEQQVHVTNIILNDYLIDKEVSNLDKLIALRVLRRFSHTYEITLDCICKRQDSSAPSVTTKTSRVHCIRGADAQSIDDILICLPATLDLSQEVLMKEFDVLKLKLNASNAKFISQALVSISRKVNDEVFLRAYLNLLGDENFSKLGVSANKEMLRLLVNYRKEPAMIKDVIYPLWSARPHQDIRACLITALLQFFGKAAKDESSLIWSILEEAAGDDYLPIIYSLFVQTYGQSEWVLTRIANTDEELFRKFVERIQYRVLDHPKKLEARTYAWSRIDHEHCDPTAIIEKAKLLCSQFDKDANTCWQSAFGKVIDCCKHMKSKSDVLVDLLQMIIDRRDEIDTKQNAIDSHHDLPVYHRVRHVIKSLASQIDQLRKDHADTIRRIATLALKFDVTLAPFLSEMLFGLATNKEELYAALVDLQKNLPSSYAEHIIDGLGSKLNKKKEMCPFVNELNGEERLAFVQWFIQEKHQELFVLDLCIEQILQDTSVDLEARQKLLRQIRQSDNLYVRQKALEYTVGWNETGANAVDSDDMSVDNGSESSDSEM